MLLLPQRHQAEIRAPTFLATGAVSPVCASRICYHLSDVRHPCFAVAVDRPVRLPEAGP